MRSRGQYIITKDEVHGYAGLFISRWALAHGCCNRRTNRTLARSG
jgi:hypothetical protein